MPNLLSPEVKMKTLELLRSGMIKQTRGCLKDEEGCRCVLGVIALAGNIPHNDAETLNSWGRGNAYDGFKDVGLEFEDCRRLFRLNDGDHRTFPELADHIEANY
jgi:hypothetical protein